MFEPSRVVTKVIEDKVRVAWDDQQEKWYFSIVNVCEVLTDRMLAPDGKMRLTASRRA